VRDRAIFVGNPDDIVPDRFGPELPLIRDWTREHYAFAGHATGFDPADFADRQALRHQLGYRDDEQVCIVTVGGSGVGGHLLRRHLAACDLAVVQGGLSTCMELTANRTPFLYFPLRHHFEQTFHVAHRLDRYRAGRRMDYATTDPDTIAAEIGRTVDYRPVETDGAARAASLIAELL